MALGLPPQEAVCAGDAFLSALYGEDIYREWTELKYEMLFTSERDFVRWLIGVVKGYKRENRSRLSQQDIDMDELSVNDSNENEAPHSYKQKIQGSKARLSSSTPIGKRVKKASKRQQVESSETVPCLVSESDYCDAVTVEGEESMNCAQQDEHNQTDHSKSNNEACGLKIETEEQQIGTLEMGATASSSDSVVRAGSSAAEDDNDTSKESVQQVTDTSFSCPHCAYTGNENDLRTHMTDNHEQEQSRTYPCPYCQYSAARKFTLESHLVRKHGLESKYPCKYCGKYFTRPCLQKGHELVCRDSNKHT